MIKEIHLSDESLRENYISEWETNFEDASDILNSSQLDDKKMIAEIFNDITTAVVVLENNSDPTFKSNRIIVSTIAPSGLSSGEIWFEEV